MSKRSLRKRMAGWLPPLFFLLAPAGIVSGFFYLRYQADSYFKESAQRCVNENGQFICRGDICLCVKKQ